MEKFIHNFIVKDRKIMQNTEVHLTDTILVYEVIRIMENTPLFLEKHLDRLFHSAKIINKLITYTVNELVQLIDNLVYSNNTSTGNIKIVLSFNDSPFEQECVMGFISHKYPDPSDYIEGIKIVSTSFQRDNPNAKIQSADVREKMNLLMSSQKAAEILYIHPDGYMTECSRSNIFFIRKNTLVTAPDSDVLPGITRDCIISIAKSLDIQLELTRLLYNDLTDIDAVFISGTSPKVLPVKSIDLYNFKLTDNILIRIKTFYDHLIDQYLLTHQKTR